MATNEGDAVTHVGEPARKPRARKNGASSISPDEVRAWADTVQPGECVTFPNGLVVDKRCVGPSWPATTGLNGWNCPTCGAWITMGSVHSCWKVG